MAYMYVWFYIVPPDNTQQSAIIPLHTEDSGVHGFSCATITITEVDPTTIVIFVSVNHPQTTVHRRAKQIRLIRL